MHQDAKILDIQGRPLFFCGCWFIDAKCENEYGWKFYKKLMFVSQETAENAKVGDWIKA